MNAKEFNKQQDYNTIVRDGKDHLSIDDVTELMENYASQLNAPGQVGVNSWIDELTKAVFWSKATQTEYCWNWQGALNETGYGVFRVKKKVFLAHRLSYIIIYGEILNDMQVCHKCDNPKCINPDHLFVGTHQDNMRDKLHKGRSRNIGRSSKYLGVGFRNDSKKWRAYIVLNDKLFYIKGNFFTEHEAAIARDKYITEHNLSVPLSQPLPAIPSQLQADGKGGR